MHEVFISGAVYVWMIRGTLRLRSVRIEQKKCKLNYFKIAKNNIRARISPIPGSLFRRQSIYRYGGRILMKNGLQSRCTSVFRARASKTLQKHHSTQQQTGGADRRALAGFWGRQCENTMIWEPDRILSAFSLTVACWRVAGREAGGRGRGRFVHGKHSKSIGK